MNGLPPTTSSPNDPPTIHLTPQQYAFAFQQFQLHMAAPIPHAPISLNPVLTSPVIDPSLLPVPVPTPNERLSAVENDLRELKASVAQKRSNEDDDQKPSKKSKKNPYILKENKNLSVEQIEVRKVLMRKIKVELRTLTGTNETSDCGSDSDGERDTPTASTSASSTLSFDFESNVDLPANMAVITRAADLIFKEQNDPTASTFSLPHTTVAFTNSDLVHFGKNTFRSWKKKYRGEHDPDVRAMQERQASRDRQGMRKKEVRASSDYPEYAQTTDNRVQLKQKRLKAVNEYKNQHNKDPACILETEWMSDEISAPDTDDDQKKAEHRRQLRRVTGLSHAQKDTEVWEVVRPGFQSVEAADVKDELDRLSKLSKAKSGRKKKANRAVLRASLGNTHDRPPTRKLWPFMLSREWYDVQVVGHPDLKEEISLYTKNPEGFGEDSGYTADVEH
ncbi:hypothetical protein B0H16DRAFT_1777864 [Mycena metata]|uniref:Uncharacterized protein n=1 Tax=Mycena metata TaxID=1033252 RepID=A0AAD7HVD0_9AGAR|nr:hypothetical protein B0H16DRAFT_1777864 [Mycena metata]